MGTLCANLSVSVSKSFLALSLSLSLWLDVTQMPEPLNLDLFRKASLSPHCMHSWGWAATKYVSNTYKKVQPLEKAVTSCGRLLAAAFSNPASFKVRPSSVMGCTSSLKGKWLQNKNMQKSNMIKLHQIAMSIHGPSVHDTDTFHNKQSRKMVKFWNENVTAFGGKPPIIVMAWHQQSYKKSNMADKNNILPGVPLWHLFLEVSSRCFHVPCKPFLYPVHRFPALHQFLLFWMSLQVGNSIPASLCLILSCYIFKNSRPVHQRTEHRKRASPRRCGPVEMLIQIKKHERYECR